MVNRMILANVLHRPVRTIVSVLAVGIEVGMVLLVVGLTTGMLNESAKRVEGVGADVMVQPPGASFSGHYHGAYAHQACRPAEGA